MLIHVGENRWEVVSRQTGEVILRTSSIELANLVLRELFGQALREQLNAA